MIKNNAIFIRRELLTRLCRYIISDGKDSQLDRIPLEMKPRNNGHIRCCVHKDRAVLKYKLMACLGFNIEDETDELTPLSEYFELANKRFELSDARLTVVDEACSSCKSGEYVVTNMCQSCDGRPCQVNCPKDAINFSSGKAQIDHDDCTNCGLCLKNCPFHAIIFAPVPCEVSCPVNAISKDENGIAKVDHDLCIYCGRCMEACPYGAVMEKSHLIEIHRLLESPHEVIAMVAPALYGQFNASPNQVHESLKALGFDQIVEVADGADITAQNEAHEFKEEVLEGDLQYMTTSCCPCYKELVKKHLPQLSQHVSSTRSPLYYTSELIRKEKPHAKLVFISPCMAKRHESFETKAAHYTLNFEEMGSMLAASEIEFNQYAEVSEESKTTKDSRVFSFSGGVTEMLKKELVNTEDLVDLAVSGIHKDSIKLLKKIGMGKSEANFVEVMACEGGCINGCNTIAKNSVALRQIKKYSK